MKHIIGRAMLALLGVAFISALIGASGWKFTLIILSISILVCAWLFVAIELIWGDD